MAENKQNTTPERRPDCVTEIRMGNTVLVVSGFFKKDTTDTAADKMMKVLEAEAAAGHKVLASSFCFCSHSKEAGSVPAVGYIIKKLPSVPQLNCAV